MRDGVTNTNEFIAEIHDRMPVILEADQFEPWLSGRASIEVLKPAADDVLQKWPVSKRVNSSRARDDDETLIDLAPNIQSAPSASDLFSA